MIGDLSGVIAQVFARTQREREGGRRVKAVTRPGIRDTRAIGLPLNATSVDKNGECTLYIYYICLFTSRVVHNLRATRNWATDAQHMICFLSRFGIKL